MNTLMRRIVIGAIAGALSSAALVAAGGHLSLNVVLGAVIGAAYSILAWFRPAIALAYVSAEHPVFRRRSSARHVP